MSTNLDDLELSNGKEYFDKQKELEELLGISKISPFGTYDLDIFKQKLKESSQVDLQKLAHRVGLNPFLDKSRIKGALEKEFIAYTKNMRKNLIPQASKQIILDKNNPQHQQTLKILGDI
jgi:hypothetical protein